MPTPAERANAALAPLVRAARSLTRLDAIDATYVAQSDAVIDGVKVRKGDVLHLAGQDRAFVRRFRRLTRRGAIDVVAAPAPAEVLCRHIGVEHLGRWVTITGRPADPRVINEPSLIHRGGRLVGYLPDPEPARSPSTRVLVLLAGGIERISVPAGETVIVAPRDWS